MSEQFYLEKMQANNFLRQILKTVVLYLIILNTFPASANDNNKSEIFHFGPGVHTLDNIILRNTHALIEGEGVGVLYSQNS